MITHITTTRIPTLDKFKSYSDGLLIDFDPLADIEQTIGIQFC